MLKLTTRMLIQVLVTKRNDFEDWTSRVWRHRVTRRHRWRHQSTRCGHFSVLETNH